MNNRKVEYNFETFGYVEISEKNSKYYSRKYLYMVTEALKYTEKIVLNSS